MQKEKIKKSYWLRILSYFKPQLILLFASMLLAVMVNAAELLRPYIIALVMDDYVINRDSTLNIYVIGIVYFATAVIGAISQYSQVCLLNRMGQSIIHRIRMEVFTHVQHMPLSYFDSHASGSILTRVTNDVESLSELYTGVFVELFKDVVMLIGIIGVMFAFNAKLALIALSIVPLILIITIIYNKKAKENFRWVRSLIGRINGFLAENISGMKLVQIFNKEKQKFNEFRDLNNEYNKASVYGVFLNALMRPGSEFINSMAICILVWFCAGDVLQSFVEVGVLYAFINYSKKFFQPINDLADKYSTIQSGAVSAERIFELLDTNSEDALKEIYKGKKSADNIKGKIEFKNVWFSYVEDEWVLKNVSFVINPGETAAFVGATGSGKSTIINLIVRFYEIQKGEILLDGVNIKNYDIDGLRRTVAIVIQDIFLFAGDIAYNIRLNNDEITDNEVISAAQYVNADSFINTYKNSYHEEVVERGASLSLGQRQLLSFARAVAFKPQILVLDEATANIDTENEMLIQQSLEKISKDRTTLVIAHRLSTIRDAHVIFVVHKGEIKERGKHGELLEKNGLYKKLYDIQST